MAQPAMNLSAQQPSVPSIVARLRNTFDAGKTRPYTWREAQLRQFLRMLDENEPAFVKALHDDFRKSEFETVITELEFLAAEARHAIKHLRSWMKPKKAKMPVVLQPAEGYLQYEPYGVALVIAPWNYPLHLAIGPVIGALAAGNAVVIKPSELAPATAEAVARYVPQYLDPDAVAVVNGGIPETNALLAERFDHIFFTGGGTVGRIVMEAAAKNLTPVTLELGGKSPVIIDQKVDLDVAARRVAWGKFLNAGQTCVAPDYVLVHQKVEQEFLEKVKENVRGFYGEDPKKSPDFPRIISDRHFSRLSKLLGSGEVVTGGQTDAAERYIAPTVLRNVSPDSPVMADEIFGPILPVIAVKSVEDAIAFVNARPKPLALYVFTDDDKTADRVLERTTSGGAVVNDVAMHLAASELPFGGVGGSGMGAYHGQAGFETFSHKKSVVKKSTKMDLKIRYPPYTASALKWLRRLM